MKNNNRIGGVLAGDNALDDCSSETTVTQLNTGDQRERERERERERGGGRERERDDVWLNLGNAYRQHNGGFHAPMKGLFMFSLSALIDNALAEEPDYRLIFAMIYHFKIAAEAHVTDGADPRPNHRI
ncbi:hypothetical protein DPMN_164019 [Dreissena polymorpha]|uniref:Uncharacterized protein n=1 Tax=Dreissena polymorpha TaxID=45954 RepID=A0A9D4EV29_DREPO|nr:hypothetical protein DPMN_164019 [Dreissena polymorpha]